MTTQRCGVHWAPRASPFWTGESGADRQSGHRHVHVHLCHPRRWSLNSPRDTPHRRNLSAELKREGSGGMSMRSFGSGLMPTASTDITIDTPVRPEPLDPRCSLLVGGPVRASTSACVLSQRTLLCFAASRWDVVAVQRGSRGTGGGPLGLGDAAVFDGTAVGSAVHICRRSADRKRVHET